MKKQKEINFNFYIKKISQCKFNNMKNSMSGITLIALIITIVILIILASVTINLTISDNGLFNQAKLAQKKYLNAVDDEKDQINRLQTSLNEILSNNNNEFLKLGTIIKTENSINYTADGAGNIIPVPDGFTAITSSDQGIKNTGFVIKNNTDGNEYVWIPVDNTNYTYDRYVFSKIDWQYTQELGDYDNDNKSYKIKWENQQDRYFVEEMPYIDNTKTELDSVTKYGGFYIGRYEVGVINYTDILTNNDSNLNSWTGYVNGNPIIQKNNQVWNYITYYKATEIASEMYKDLTNVVSRLCSSYAWDTTLKFIEINDATYSTSTNFGNYMNLNFNYTDLNGNILTKDNNHSILVPSGQTKSVNNIYDLGGNLWEYTSENCNLYQKTARGGVYEGKSNIYPARSS